MPKEIRQAIADHAKAKWTVWHTTNQSHHYCDIYFADGKPIFELVWYDKMSKPCYKVY